MRQVRNTDVVPDAAVYNAAISAYQKAQNFDEMEQLFKEMKEKRCMPDEITYSVMIETYRRRGMFEDAKKLQLEWEAEQSRGLT
jgi:pentatricopeptide repeat protein